MTTKTYEVSMESYREGQLSKIELKELFFDDKKNSKQN